MGLTPVKFSNARLPQPRLTKPYVPGKHSSRFWSEAEAEIMRQHYPVSGAQGCLALLPGRDLNGVYGQAKKLGLKAPAVSGGPRQKRDVSPEAKARIVEAWPLLEGRGAVKALAAELGLPRHVVTVTATKLGLTMPHRKESKWSASEDALMAKVPLHDPRRASEIFKQHGYRRSPSAIVCRSRKLGMSRRYKETFSATAAAKVLGVDGKFVTTLCIDGDLVASRRQTQRLPQQGGDPWSIERADLRRYVIDHLERIDFRKVDKFALVDLLTNGESA